MVLAKQTLFFFFEFLAKLSTAPIANAVSSVGGAGSIFKKIRKEEYQDHISIKIYGSVSQNNEYYVYEYVNIIKSSFEKDDIFYSYQDLKIRTATKFWSDPDKLRTRKEWGFHIEYKNPENDKGEIVIHHINDDKFKPVFFFDTKRKQGKNEDSIVKFVEQNNPSSRTIVSSLFPMIERTFIIMSDLIGGESFNVVPSKIKESEDAATPPGIKKDGSGLSTTLYALKKGKPTIQNHPRYGFIVERVDKSFNPRTLTKIITYLKLANQTISSLDVTNDPFDNRLIVKITVKSGDYEAVLPLSSMSDGTIKWLALITAIMTSKTIFSIEEPENFLHPWMQAEIINIMREHIDNKKNDSFVIMTTHSESLLNYSKAEELILVDLKDGQTEAKRIGEVENLNREIANTGFGLGHFYFSESLQ